MRWTFFDSTSCGPRYWVLLGGIALAVGCGGSTETAPVASSSPASATSSTPSASSADAGDDSGYGDSGYGDSGYSDSGYGDSGYGDSGYGDSGYGDSGYGDSGYGDSGYGDSGYGDSGYGYDSGYGSGYGGQRSGGPLQSVLGTLAAPVTAQLTRAISDPAAAGPVSLLEQSATAFEAGNEALAEQLLYAHMVAEPHTAAESFQAVAYSRWLRRPIWKLRWGVSFHLRANEDTTDPHPVVENMASPRGTNAGRGSRGGGGGYDDGGYDGGGYDDGGYDSGGGYSDSGSAAPGGGPGGLASPDSPEVSIPRNLGLVGEVAGEMFSERFGRGDFGKVFSVMAAAMAPVPEKPSQPGQDGYSGDGGYDGDGGYGYDGDGGYDGGGYDGDGGYNGGGYDGGGYNGDGGYNGGGYNGGGYNGGYGQPQRAAAAAAAAAPPSVPAPQLPRWKPGIVFVGQGNGPEMLEKARAHGLDFLLHFDVIVNTGRNDSVKNLTRARVCAVADGSTVVVSKGIDNHEIYDRVNPPRRRGGKPDEGSGVTERELVAEALTNLFEVIDARVRVEPMPPVTAPVAMKRVGALVASAGASDLRTLAEIRLYEFLRLLQPADLQAAMSLAAGDGGLVLLYGLPSQRRELVLAKVNAPRQP